MLYALYTLVAILLPDTSLVSNSTSDLEDLIIFSHIWADECS